MFLAHKLHTATLEFELFKKGDSQSEIYNGAKVVDLNN